MDMEWKILEQLNKNKFVMLIAAHIKIVLETKHFAIMKMNVKLRIDKDAA
jgi:hypothetical protein